MCKTRSEYQKEYRERKKLQDKDFLKRERHRTKQYKLPISALDKDKQNELREKNRLWKRQSRERKRNKIQQEKDREREEIPKTPRHKPIAMNSIILNGQQETKVVNQ